MTLKEAIIQAQENKTAIGHFNISDIAALHAIVKAAQEVRVPIIIGTSEGEAEFVDIDVAAAMVKDEREESGHPIFLNADHFHDLELAKKAASAGYDSVIFDAAKLGLEENIAKTKEAVTVLRAIKSDLLVEGELGYIGSSSKLLDEMPEGVTIEEAALPTPEIARRYVKETGVDLLAPAVGNIHGMFKNASNPKLSISLIGKIKEATGVPLVLHGGSGISDDDFKAAVAAGMSVVHVNTEIRAAWRRGLERAMFEDKDQIAPYKLFPEAEEEIYEVVLQRLKLWNGLI